MRNRKRGNGEGSIYKRSNNTWTGKIMLGYKSDGKPNRKSVYGKTKKEVQIKLSKLANLNYTGTYIEPSKCLFKDWIINWLNEYKKVKIKPTTYDCYDNIIESIIIPKLGKYKLCDLTNEIIQKFINNMKLGSKNYSSSTIVKTHMIINNSLKQAIVNKMIMNNPASNIELPKRIQKQIRAFTIEEEKRFLESAKGYRLYEAFLFNLDTGLRLSEILAIKWEDIDLKKKTVIINKNLVEAKNRSKNQRGKLELIVQNTTKTENGKRILPLTERTIRMLKEYKLKSQKKSEIVFCSQNDTYVRPRNYKRTFYKIIENASIEKCGAHTLRHTYATRLFEANIDAKVVSELLGHKDISVTLNTYVHVLKSKKREAIRALDELISGVK